MESHQHFLNSISAAPQDVSLPVLQDLLGKGYDTTVWQTYPASTDPICVAKNGDRVPLADFISGLQHNAPFYEGSSTGAHGAHVGCRCSVLVSGPGLEDVQVNAFGLVS